jgi:hypothetical protein
MSPTWYDDPRKFALHVDSSACVKVAILKSSKHICCYIMSMSQDPACWKSRRRYTGSMTRRRNDLFVHVSSESFLFSCYMRSINLGLIKNRI